MTRHGSAWGDRREMTGERGKARLAYRKGGGWLVDETDRSALGTDVCIPRDQLKPHLPFEGQRRGTACAGCQRQGGPDRLRLRGCSPMAIIDAGFLALSARDNNHDFWQ